MHCQRLILCALLLLIPGSFSWSLSHGGTAVNRSSTDECCVSAKLNVGSKKANQGREFFRQLATNVTAYKEVNPANMCDLIHFLIQEASMNNKSVTFTKGMFIIFDSPNQIFEQLMKAKDQQKSGDDAQYAGYFQRLKYMGKQAIDDLLKKAPAKSDTFIYVRGDESSHYHGERGSKWDRTREYPAYGMDIPGACMPSGFGHILFGKLPSLERQGKYAGERIYIKPELFGIRQLKQFIRHAQSYLDHVSKRYVCHLKEMETKPGCSSEEAFRENTDKKLLQKWQAVLSTVPITGTSVEQMMRNATTYGIGEIYRQATRLEATNGGDKVKGFLAAMEKQYGSEDISVRKGREIIFTTEGLIHSPLTCEFWSSMKKC